MLSSRIAFILAALIALWPGQVMAASGGPGPLERRLVAWPEWSLPAPLSRPGRSDLRYPDWFAGAWWVHSLEEGSAAPIPPYAVRFLMDQHGSVVGDRAFNATQVGDALLGGQLLSVANDPANPNRQLALLRGDLELESTVIGRRSQGDSQTVALGDSFLSDELALQVLHGPGGAVAGQLPVTGAGAGGPCRRQPSPLVAAQPQPLSTRIRVWSGKPAR
jgi:hypothetical protein